MKAVLLKRGREKSLMRRHPWIFSGAIARIEGNPRAGETVDILAAEGALLGRGAYSPRSQMTDTVAFHMSGSKCSVRLVASASDVLPPWAQ